MIKTVGKHLLYLLTGIVVLSISTGIILAIITSFKWVLETVRDIFGLYDAAESLYLIFWAIPIFIYLVGRGILESYLEYKNSDSRTIQKITENPPQ